MKINNIIVGVVGIMICAIMIGGAFLPAVGSAGLETRINDYGSVADFSEKDWTAEFIVNGTDVTWTVNGVIQSDYEMDKNGRVFLVMSDSTYFYYDLVSGSAPSSIGISYINNEGKTFTALGVQSCTISASNGVITYTPVMTDTTIEPIVKPYDWLFVASDNGAYRTFNLSNYGNATIYFNNISDVYGVNYVSTTDNVWFSFNGSTVKYGFDTITMNIDTDRIGEDIYKSDINTASSDWSFIVDNNGTPYTVNPFVWIVPYKVIGHDMGFTAPVRAMFGVLPIIAIAGLVMAGIYVFISRK